MKNFEERRKDYFQRLRKYSETIVKLSKDKKNEKLVEVLLIPRTEKELEFANAYILYIEDAIQICIHTACENVEKIDPDNNLFMDYLVSFINAVCNNTSADEMQKIVEPYMENNKKLIAEVIYQMLVLTYSNPEGLTESLYKKCNIDFDDELQVMQLTVLMNKASAQLHPELVLVTDEALDDFILYTKHFHNVCMKGIKDPFNKEVEEILAELDDKTENDQGFTRSRFLK